MKIGISTFVNDDTIDTVSLARGIEERGFDSLVIAEHTHIPASRESDYPMGGELPSIYYRTLDPFVTLAAAAAVTTKIELITGIALLVQRDPIITAKEAASIDLISNGRFAFGVGAGWNIEELRNHGTDPKTRGALLDERIEAIKELWTNDPAEYHGTYVDFDPIWQWPKPVQKPHPPVLVGGLGEKVYDRVVAYGDEWIPNRVKSPEDLAGRIADLQRRAEEAGREPIPVTVFGAKSDVPLLERLRDAGVTRSLFYLPPGEPGEVERALDRLAEVAAQWDG
jgi:probable F420-dependent oxidoreductase